MIAPTVVTGMWAGISTATRAWGFHIKPEPDPSILGPVVFSVSRRGGVDLGIFLVFTARERGCKAGL